MEKGKRQEKGKSEDEMKRLQSPPKSEIKPQNLIYPEERRKEKRKRIRDTRKGNPGKMRKRELSRHQSPRSDPVQGESHPERPSLETEEKEILPRSEERGILKVLLIQLKGKSKNERRRTKMRFSFYCTTQTIVLKSTKSHYHFCWLSSWPPGEQLPPGRGWRTLGAWWHSGGTKSR